MMAVEVRSGAKLDVGAPKTLFDAHPPSTWYDVGKDGRFVIPQQAAQASTPPITVVQNWQATLRK
jgi:hypothetical protein